MMPTNPMLSLIRFLLFLSAALVAIPEALKTYFTRLVPMLWRVAFSNNPSAAWAKEAAKQVESAVQTAQESAPKPEKLTPTQELSIVDEVNGLIGQLEESKKDPEECLELIRAIGLLLNVLYIQGDYSPETIQENFADRVNAVNCGYGMTVFTQ